MSFVNGWVEFADLMKRGMLFHSLAAVTVNILSPALVRVRGYVRRSGSELERRLGQHK